MPPFPKPKYLREYRVQLESVREGEVVIDTENAGCRTKLGGKPDYIQDKEEPDLPPCPTCNQPMHFIAQIDSVEHFWPTNPNRKMPPDQHLRVLLLQMPEASCITSVPLTESGIGQ